MRRPVRADKTGAIHREAHRQRLDRHVVHDLVVGALQERRIDRGERLHAFGGKTGGERHAMLLGDADIEGALGKLLREQIEARARRHRGRDGDDAIVLLGFRDQRFAEHFLILRRLRGRLALLAGEHVEFRRRRDICRRWLRRAHSLCPSCVTT